MTFSTTNAVMTFSSPIKALDAPQRGSPCKTGTGDYVDVLVTCVKYKGG